MIRQLLIRLDTWIQDIPSRRFYTGIALIYAVAVALGIYAWERCRQVDQDPPSQCVGPRPPLACDEGAP